MKVAIFPGQGSQYVGMGKDLYEFDAVRRLFQEAEDLLGRHLARILFEGSDEDLRQTAIAQPGIFVTSMALMHLLEQEYGVTIRDFGCAAGHSLGEFSALCAAGVLTFAAAVRLIGQRCDIMGRIQGGAMAAILGLSRPALEQALQTMDPAVSGVCDLANENTPEQIVISGDHSAVVDVAQRITAYGASRAIILNVSGPFHSRLMRPAQKAFAEVLENVVFSDAIIPVVTNVSAVARTHAQDLKYDCAHQMAQGVLWAPTQTWCVGQGATTFVEIGPGKVLCGLARKTVPGIKTLALNSVDDLRHWTRATDTAGVSCLADADVPVQSMAV